ncbi:hypothetical protein WG899_04295 [Paucibacter sp. AS339]|uniref:hypothetical protein n=1 Tax=Paucibacter hankyongi TaxID=3133434 RepID=UPI0030A09B81
MSELPEREKLYAEIWAVPMIHLSKRYGLSGPGLRQFCEKLGIPVPGRGHWAKLAAGHEVPRPTLPPLALALEVDTSGRQRRKGGRPSQQASAENDPRSARSDPQQPSLEQSDEMPPLELHPLIRALLPLYDKEATEALQRKAKHEWEEINPGRPYRGVAPPHYSWQYFCDRGQILAPTHKKSAIRVSLMTYKRALHLMSSLVASLEKLGFQLMFSEHRQRLIAKRGEAHISIRLTEKLDAGTRFDRINSYTREKESVKTLTPTGRLSLGIEEMGFGETIVSDTSTTSLETKWDAVLSAAELRHRGSLEAVARWKRQRDEQEEATRRRADEQRLREIAQRMAAEETARRDALLSEALNWQNSQLILSYVAHLDRLRDVSGNVSEGFDAWREWARGVATALDQSSTRLAE